MWIFFQSSACVVIHPRLWRQSPQVRSAAAIPKSILLTTWGLHFIFYEIIVLNSCKFALWCVADGVLQQKKRSHSIPAQIGKVMDFLVLKTPASRLGTCGRLSTLGNGPKREDSYTTLHPWRHVASGSSFRVVLV